MPLNIARWRWRTTLLMAFFGLTALGPQSTFETSLVDFSYLNVFTPADQEEAFSAIDGGRGYLEGDQVSETTAHTRSIPVALKNARLRF